jgi:hypothetical protein
MFDRLDPERLTGSTLRNYNAATAHQKSAVNAGDIERSGHSKMTVSNHPSQPPERLFQASVEPSLD